LQLVGASPRYQLYPTKDGKLVACGALEDKFWAAFTSAIGLSPVLADDKKNAKATRDAVATIVASRSADEWRPVFAKADCCVTIVAPLSDAVRDPHFTGRGLFAHRLEAQSGATMPALPVPIAPVFREKPGKKKAPKLD
jgi:crotonobetainyl-CoA:carnitine CoA-transferase CaiB-like acyl-CoA transferase